MTMSKEDQNAVTLKVNKGTITAIIVALAGFAWNKMEAYLDRDEIRTTSSVHETSYQLTKREVEALWEAIDAIEEHLEEAEVIDEPIPAAMPLHVPNEVIERIHALAPEPPPIDDGGQQLVNDDPGPVVEPEPSPPVPMVDETKPKRRLPDYETVQKAVKAGQIEE